MPATVRNPRSRKARSRPAVTRRRGAHDAQRRNRQGDGGSFDWLFLDMEHGVMSLEACAQISTAALDAGIAPIARVPNGEYAIATPSSQSVHWAGISARLPSERQASTNRTPRRRILPMTASAQPSKGWRSRVMITELGNSRRWVVCRPFFRPGQSRQLDGAPGRAGD